jgi:group II intron reverse transcriptase/maturase
LLLLSDIGNGIRASGSANAGALTLTITEVEQYGVSRLLDELAADLKDGSYRPLAARRVWIDKPGTAEQRPLSVPSVRDRIVQAATKIVIEPVFEADFLPCSFGFRPQRAQQDALQVLIDEAWQGRRWVVESDVASCFETIPHDRLLQAVEERICDRHVLKLLRGMLRAGVMQDGAVHRPVTGTPQGGIVSPLLANVYLHRLDRVWETDGVGVLVRYADDLVRHEALFDRVEMKGLHRWPVAAGRQKLGAARCWRCSRGWEAASTTTGRAGIARRLGSGKQGERVYERNQR